MDALTYAPVGGTQNAVLVAPSGYRASERTTRIGAGAEFWQFAVHELMTWGIKRRAGFRVPALGVRPGDDVTLTFGWGVLSLHEPVRVVQVIDEPRRRGFAYGTRAGHPIRGEESFIVEHRSDDSVWLTIRSFSRPSSAGWWVLDPLLRIAQLIVTRRYLRALAQPIH